MITRQKAQELYFNSDIMKEAGDVAGKILEKLDQLITERASSGYRTLTFKYDYDKENDVDEFIEAILGEEADGRFSQTMLAEMARKEVTEKLLEAKFFLNNSIVEVGYAKLKEMMYEIMW